MQNDIRYLELIVSYCDKIEDAITVFGNDIDDFIDNDHYSQSCAFSLFQIGELVKRLSFETTNGYPTIPWSDIARFRDLIAHKYTKLDTFSIWETITKDIPELRENCLHIINDYKRKE